MRSTEAAASASGAFQICDLEGQVESRTAGEATSHPARGLDLVLGDIETARGNSRKAERPGSCYEPAQPCAGTAASVEDADRARAGGPEVVQFRFEHRPNLPVCISVRAIEGEQAIGVPIRVSEIVVTGPIVCGRYALIRRQALREIGATKSRFSVHVVEPVYERWV